MRSLAELDDAEARRIEGFFFDLDDTVLTHGVLGRAAYAALWDLHESGLPLVAVTGRPSAWGEVLVRQWPIDGAVTETGAVFVEREGHGVRVLVDGSAEEVRARRSELDALVARVKLQLPELRLSDDSHGRRADVAWDIGERATVPEERIAELTRVIVGAGARTTRSTVHVHATFERDDKASGALRFVRDKLGADPGRVVRRWAFAGDSTNDASCFAAFHTTFGVANVRRFVRALSVPPRFIASRERGEGFAEIASMLLARREGER